MLASDALRDVIQAVSTVLVVGLILFPFGSERPQSLEPAEAPAEDDYEYWLQLRRRDGLPELRAHDAMGMGVTPSATAASVAGGTTASNVLAAESSRRGRQRDRKRGRAASQNDEGSHQEQRPRTKGKSSEWSPPRSPRTLSAAQQVATPPLPAGLTPSTAQSPASSVEATEQRERTVLSAQRPHNDDATAANAVKASGVDAQTSATCRVLTIVEELGAVRTRAPSDVAGAEVPIEVVTAVDTQLEAGDTAPPSSCHSTEAAAALGMSGAFPASGEPSKVLVRPPTLSPIRPLLVRELPRAASTPSQTLQVTLLPAEHQVRRRVVGEGDSAGSRAQPDAMPRASRYTPRDGDGEGHRAVPISLAPRQIVVRRRVRPDSS